MSFCKYSFCALFTLGIFLLVFMLERREFDPGGTTAGHRIKSSPFSVIYQALVSNPSYLHFQQDINKESPKMKSCLFHSCFDINQCNLHHRNIKVHIYPMAKYYSESTVLEISAEYLQILEAIASSEMYTSNPDEACLFIPSVDTLNFKHHRTSLPSLLQSLQYWNGGKNHLIFNFLEDPDSLTVGSAMIASPNFNTFSYRSNFDISIPLYVPSSRNNLVESNPALSSQLNFNKIKPDEKKIKLLVFSDTVDQLILDDLKSGSATVVCTRPCSPPNQNLFCSQGMKKMDQESLISSARFCFVSVQNSVVTNLQLSLYLELGCVPVILAAAQHILPFSEIVDWSQLSVQIRPKDLGSIDNILDTVTEHKYKQKLTQMHKVFHSYMKTPGHIALTTLQILDARMFPEKGLSNPVWNMDTTHQSPLFLDRYPRPSGGGFTAVILTYNRVQSLFEILTKLERVPSLARILVIWNHQTIPPPSTNEWPKINKPMKVLQTPENRLSNRFYPYAEIETEAVFSLDDDITMLSTDEIEFGFQVWREFPDRIVGYPSRLHVWNQSSLSWTYDSEWKNEHSMILTGAAFYNNYWSYVYTGGSQHRGLKELRQWVDDNMNCEDIAFNFMVSNTTSKPNIKVGPRKKFRCLTVECDNSGMLSQDLSHLAKRSQCINKFTRVYGGMPLKSVEWRADPVLYKENLPPNVQVFSDIGSL